MALCNTAFHTYTNATHELYACGFFVVITERKCYNKIINCNALMLAVGSGDAPMVHFLIKHGADANFWPGKGVEPALGEGNYYLDDIDIHFMNECFANDKDINYLKALHRTALVLVEAAHLGPYSGYSLKISEDGIVSSLIHQRLEPEGCLRITLDTTHDDTVETNKE